MAISQKSKTTNLRVSPSAQVESQGLQQAQHINLPFHMQVNPSGSAIRFPYLNLSTMPMEERGRLVTRLEEESENITLQYARLIVLTAKSLARGTTNDELRTFFRSSGLREIVDSIQPADNVHDIIGRLTQQNYWTFFNYKLLATIIQTFCFSEIGPELAHYESCFRTYCQRRIFEVPAAALRCAVASSSSSQQPHLVLKFDDRFNVSDSLIRIDNIRHRIEQLLGLEYLNLVDISSGCIELTFRYFQRREDILETIKLKFVDFAQLGVKQLQCGSFEVYFVAQPHLGPPPPISPKSKTQRQKPKKPMVGTKKIAGQRRGIKRRKSSLTSVGIGIVASESVCSELAEAVQKRNSSPQSDSDSEQPPKKRARRIIRCPAHLAYLCETCSKKDCGTCSNCLIKDQDGLHLCCEQKQADRCLTYLKMQQVKKKKTIKRTSSERSKDSLQSPMEHQEHVLHPISASLSTSLANEIILQVRNAPSTSSNTSVNNDGDMAGAQNLVLPDPLSEKVLATNNTCPSPVFPTPSTSTCSESVAETRSLHQEQQRSTVPPSPDCLTPSSSIKAFTVVEPQQSQQSSSNNAFQEEASNTSPSSSIPQGASFQRETSQASTTLQSQSSQGDCDEDDQLDEIIETILMRGLADGKVKLQIIKCGVSGPPETGKTHVRALMLCRQRPRQRRSTTVATEADQATPDYQRFDEKFDEKLVNMMTSRKGNVWRVIQEGTMAGIIAKTLHNEDYKKTGAEESMSEPPLRSELRERCKVIRSVKKELRKMQGNPKKRRKGLNDIRLVYFVDTGGQPQFQEILPNFVKCDINLLVHNLSQDLAYCPRFNYVVDDKQFTVPAQMKLSNGDIIEQSVRSITSSISTSECKPSVAIIGTFKDKCNPGSDHYKQMLKDKTAEINKRLHSYIGSGRDKCGIFSPQRSQEQRIFAIDASEHGWESNFDSLETLRSHILESAKKHPVEVPIRYFLFLQCLRDFCKTKSSRKDQYITLDECYHVASVNDIAMTKSDVKKALELFDNCNLILYFPGILENIAFVKPGFLFGMVTDLIVASFRCESDVMTEERTSFQTTGIFTRRILNDVTSLRLSDENFTQKHFLDLLKGLFIIAEVDHGKYFMPCVLPLEIASEELKITMECMNSNGIDGPLMLSFPQKMSPRGLFCALVVALVAGSLWKLSERTYQRRNLVEFEVMHSSNYIGQCTVIDRKSHFEVYTTCDPSYCPIIKQAVTRAFETACDNMNYKDSKIIGLPCRSCKEPAQPLHSTQVVQMPESGIWKERCSIHPRRKHIPLTPDRLWWFKSTTSQNDTQEFFKLLCSEVAPRTNKWRAIALNLNFDPVTVNRIEIERRDDIQECFVRVFEHWHRQRDPPFTWNTIIDVLDQPSVSEAALAEELRQKYC